MNKITVEEIKRLNAERTQGDLEKAKSFSDCYIKIVGVGVIARGILPNDADFFVAAPAIAALCIEQAEELSSMSNIIAGLNQRLYEAYKQREEFGELIGILKGEAEKWKNQATLVTEQIERVVESQAELRDVMDKEMEQLRAENDRLRGGWMDIASAPRDGTEILITDGRDVCTAKYSISNCTQDAPYFATTANSEFYDIGSYYRTELQYISAKYWQPKPQPPTNDKQGDY